MLEIDIVQALITAIMGLFPTIPAGVTRFMQSLTGQLPSLVAAGTDINAFVSTQLALVKSMVAAKRDPTPAEWDALDAAMATELATLNAQGTPPTA